MAAEIDWSSADVEDGALSVELSERVSKEWRGRFAAVLARLGREGSAWGEVVAHKHRITVADVQPGAEEELCHLLESAALQAGADEPPREQEASSEPEKDSTDVQLRETFRAFAAVER